MTLIQPNAFTTPTTEGIVRRVLFERFLRATGLGATGTATGGGAGTFDDTTKLKSTQYNSRDWVGGWARISYDAGGAAAAPETEIAPITTYDPTTNARITVNPAFSVNPASGDKYELWLNPNPRDVVEILDELLTQRIYRPCWSLLTEVPDGDMEQTHTTDWQAGTGATVTKGVPTSTGPGLDNRYLAVAADGTGNRYAYSQSLMVEPGKQYFCSVGIYAPATTSQCRVDVYDNSNSSAIDSYTFSRRFFSRINFTFTTPASCRSIEVRLYSVTASTSAYFDDVVLYPTSAQSIRLPWWVRHPNQVKRIYQLQPTAITTNLWSAELVGRDVTKFWMIKDTPGDGGLRLVSMFEEPIGTHPLFIVGLRNELAYANDNSDKKYIDSDYLIAALAKQVFWNLSQRPISGQIESRWIESRFGYWNSEFNKLDLVQNARIDSSFRTASPMIVIPNRYDFGGL